MVHTVRSALNTYYVYDESTCLFNPTRTVTEKLNYTSMNATCYILPIADRKILNLKTGRIRNRTSADLFTVELPFDHVLTGPFPEIEQLFNTLFNNDVYMIQYQIAQCCKMLTGTYIPSTVS